MTWFNTRTIDTSGSSSYTDKHNKRIADSIKHFVKHDIERIGEDKKFA